MSVLKPEKLTRFSLLQVTIIIAIAAGLTILNYQAPISIISPGIDEAWAYTLNYLHSNNLLMGRDHFFTFGPLGYLEHTRATAEKNINQSLYFWLVIITAMNISLLTLAKLCSTSKLSYAVNMAIAIGLALCVKYAGMKILVLTYCLALIYWVSRKEIVLLFLAAVAVTAGNMKFSYAFICSALLIGVSLSASIQDKKYSPLLIALVSLIALHLLFWIFIFNGSINDSINYLVMGLENSRSHANSMTTYPPNSPLLIITLITLSTLIMYMGTKPRTKAELLFFLTWCAITLIWFKYAFTRQDSQHLGAYFAYIFYIGSLFIILRRKNESWYIAALIIATFFCWQKIHSEETGSPELFMALNYGDNSYTNLANSAFYPALKDLDHKALKTLELPNKIRAEIGSSTVAIYPWENTIAEANKLNWRAMPILQQYLANTPLLDSKNADFFSHDSAPEFIVWHQINGEFAVDDRYFLSESPQTTSSIFSNYKKQDCDINFCLWKKQKTNHAQKITKSDFFNVDLNEKIIVPKGEIIKLNLRVSFSITGKLVDIFWRRPPIRVLYQLTDGTSHEHRLPIENAKNGLWINPYLSSPAQNLNEAAQVESIAIIADTKYFAKVRGQWVANKTLAATQVGNRISQDRRPNFLFIITDDQSWEHASIAGEKAIETPNFDKIAKQGLYFSNAFVSAPSCTASRAAIITGRPFWQLENASQLWGEFDVKALRSYQYILSEQGYRTGYTGKGWGPGKFINGDPLGRQYNKHKLDTYPELTLQDLVKNFNEFLDSTNLDQPFSFWIGATEPHRPYRNGIGTPELVDHSNIRVPQFLPDHPDIRQDIADYLFEINWFDKQLGQIIELLKEKGLYENTVIVYSSDNGMPFPRSKATLYHHGTRVPLAIQWGSKKYADNFKRFVNLIDIAPTFLELAGIEPPATMQGHSLAKILLHQPDPLPPNYTVSGRERHIPNARAGNLGFPARAIYQQDYVYIYNFKPDRSPAGDAPNYEDIDNSSATKLALLYGESDDIVLAKEKILSQLPQEELYYLPDDPYQLNNVALDKKHAVKRSELKRLLFDYLKTTKDPRVNNQGDLFEAVPSYMP